MGRLRDAKSVSGLRHYSNHCSTVGDPQTGKSHVFPAPPNNRPEKPTERGLTKAEHPPNGRGSLTSNWYGPFV